MSRKRRKEWGLTELGTGKQSFLERISTRGTKDMQFPHNGRLAPNTGTIQLFFILYGSDLVNGDLFLILLTKRKQSACRNKDLNMQTDSPCYWKKMFVYCLYWHGTSLNFVLCHLIWC